MPTSSASSSTTATRFGVLALCYCGQRLPLQVLRSAAGYYLGTDDGTEPVSRESVEYFPTHAAAQLTLDSHTWTQRSAP